MTTTINNTQDGTPVDGPTLPTRVFMVERQVTDLKQDMTKGFADVRSEQAGNHTELKGLISTLASAQAERSKIQWPAISVVVGILGVAGTLVYGPIKERQGEMVDGMRDRVTKEEFATTLNAIGARRDDAQRTMENRVGRIENDVDRLQQSVVPRGEHEAHWAEQRDRDGMMQRSIETLLHPGYLLGRR